MLVSLNLPEAAKSLLSIFLGNLEGGCEQECVRVGVREQLLLPLPVCTMLDDDAKYRSPWEEVGD